jgi:CRISPR-associated protein Csa3
LDNCSKTQRGIHLEVTPQTITPNLKTLEFSGLLSSRRGTIKRGDPSGGKSGVKIWRLTGEGKVYAAFSVRKNFDRVHYLHEIKQK